MGKRWKQQLTIFLGSKITEDGDCSHEIKIRLLLERKVMTNLDSILKRRDITLPTNVHLVKVMVFPVVMYGCESSTVKKAELQRTDAFYGDFYFLFFIFIFLILKSLILTCIPKHEPHSHLPPHNISLGHPHAPAPSMLYRTVYNSQDMETT